MPMNNKVNYTFVGFIVLLGFVTVSIFSYWMLKPSHADENKNYVIYFDESVFGLNLDAPVKFRGISVGKVANLRINPNNSEQVEVQVAILKDTPIKNNIVAVLTAQGITGLTYINLTVGEPYVQEIVQINGDDFHIIASAPSLFRNLEKSFGNVSEHMSTTLFQAEKFLNDDNQQEFMRLVSSIANVSDKLDKVMDEKTVKHFQNSMANLDGAIGKIDLLVDNTIRWENNISASLLSVSQSYKKIDASMVEFQKALKSGDFNIKEITSELVPNMNNTLLEVQQTMIKLDNTIQKYERSPSDLLFKHEEIRRGPGEK